MVKQGKAAPKLPIRQMVILAVARFAEPLAYTSVFPYLPEMIRDFGVEQNEVAKWAGITSAVFSFAQSLTAVPWGKASDRYGRKPTLLIGLLCTMTTFVIWGMSTSLSMAIVVRAIQGGGNGNVGIIRTMVAEMVPEKELQPRAFSMMPLVWSLGSVVGPSFGGFLAQPAKKFPALFGDIEYFKRFPYALPNLVAMVFFLISASSAFFLLHETLPTKRGKRDPGIAAGKRLARAFGSGQKPNPRRSSFVDGEATAPLIPSQVRPSQRPKDTVQPAPGLSEVFTYQTVLNLASYTFLAFHSVAYDQNLTVFLNYPVKERTPENTKLPFYFNGGFGLNSGEIGTLFAVYGIVCGLVQFIIYSPLVTRYGVLRCFQICSIILPILYIATPYTSLFPTHKGRITALLIVMFLKAFSIIVAFPSTTILLTNSCTSLRILGTLNGFATMFSGLGRAVGPASTGWAFSWGAENNYAVTAWFFLAVVAAIGAIPVFMIVEGEGPTASVENSDAEDSEGAEESTGLLPNESAIDEDDEEDDRRTALNNPNAPLLARQNKEGNGYSTISSGTK